MAASVIKLENEPRLSGESSALIEWARRVTQVANPIADAVGPIRVPATSVIETLDGPAFSARLSADQGVTLNNSTGCSFNAEDFDTANCFDTSLARFTPNVAGYYQINAGLGLSLATGLITNGQIWLYKNGAQIRQIGVDFGGGGQSIIVRNGSFVIQMNGATDYLQVVGYVGAASGTTPQFLAAGSQFSGFLARRA